jgi:hypothetical protein
MRRLTNITTRHGIGLKILELEILAFIGSMPMPMPLVPRGDYGGGIKAEWKECIEEEWKEWNEWNWSRGNLTE